MVVPLILGLEGAETAMLVIAGIGLGLSVFSLAITKRIVYTEEYQRKREITSEWQEEYQEAMKNNEEKKVKKLEKQQEKIQKMQASLLFQSLKTFPVTIIPFYAIFLWMQGVYGPLGNFVNLPIAIPFIAADGTIGFFIWYLFASFTSSVILRKVFDIG